MEKLIVAMVALAASVGASALLGALFQWSWNLLIAANTSMPELMFYQAWGIWVLFIVVVRVLRGGRTQG